MIANLTPAEQEFRKAILEALRGLSDIDRCDEVDRLLTKARQCYLSIRLEQDTEVLNAEQAAVDLLKKERDQARAACAEMRWCVRVVLADGVEPNTGHIIDKTIWKNACYHAIQSDCGKDMLEKLSELQSLLKETTKFHLRTEDHRDWLERRDKVLKC